MREEIGNDHESPPARSIIAIGGSPDEDSSAIVRLAVTSNDDEPEEAPTIHQSRSTCTATPTSSPELQPIVPTPLRSPERYQILGEHGHGGIGRVSRAHDLELGRDVAIKELISRGALTEARFLREALITARLEHPGIVPMYEAGRWLDGTPFYAMRLVSGRPLRDLIAERTSVDQRIGLLHHVIAVSDAIAYAHGRNIIHRDLKPANIIVGDFGETIVIDWGLAKDLTAAHEPTIDGGSPYHAREHDLTAEGAVLGTPTYMAPEQARGEHVDQRADVFAIGAMLWEICALEKVPPIERRLRHGILRRAGIDQDLITIIDKALHSSPEQRYPHAGALAADLKAFKAGARIAARDYSLLATLRHKIRRHRTLTFTIVIALAFTLASGIVYVHNIASERDRADAALARVAATQDELGVKHAELTLKHAELLMTSDPSAALDSLLTYDGNDNTRLNQLRAEAIGRGTAILRAQPHTDRIPWVHGLSNGSIISLSRDGTISRTSFDGRSVVLANDVAPNAAFAYEASRHLLAYVCNPSDLCMLDVLRGKRLSLTQKGSGSQLLGIAFSPTGSLLASISLSGDLHVLDVTDPDQPKELLHTATRDGGGVLFVDEDAIAVGTRAGLRLVRISGSIQTLLDSDGTYWDAIPRDHQLVLATSRGQAYLAETAPLRITTRVSLCNGPISGLKVVPSKPMVAFTCKEGTVGTWELLNGAITFRADLEGHANTIEASADGKYLVAAGDGGALTIVDLDTNLVTTLRGHGLRLTAISPPTADFPRFISADTSGRIRVWRLPANFVKIAGKSRKRVLAAVYNKSIDMAIGSMRGLGLVIFSPKAGTVTIEPFKEDTSLIAISGDHRKFVTYGQSTSVVVWSSRDMSQRRVFDTARSSVSHVAFVNSTEDFVTSGRDGSLIRWKPNGEQMLLHRFEQPIETFAFAGRNNAMVLSTNDGELWRVDEEGHAIPLRRTASKITWMQALPDGISICVAYSNGEIVVIDTSSWHQFVAFRTHAAIHDIAITADNKTIMIADNDHTIHIGNRHGNTWEPKHTIWTSIQISARRIALTPERILVAISSDGTIWLYSLMHQTWLCISIGTTDLTHIILLDNANVAAVFDADGRVVSLQLKTIREILEAPVSKEVQQHD